MLDKTHSLCIYLLLKQIIEDCLLPASSVRCAMLGLPGGKEDFNTIYFPHFNLNFCMLKPTNSDLKKRHVENCHPNTKPPIQIQPTAVPLLPAITSPSTPAWLDALMSTNPESMMDHDSQSTPKPPQPPVYGQPVSM